eukprot:gene671-7327_t
MAAKAAEPTVVRAEAARPGGEATSSTPTLDTLDQEKPKPLPQAQAAVAALPRDGLEKRRGASAVLRQRRRAEQVDALRKSGGEDPQN